MARKQTARARRATMRNLAKARRGLKARPAKRRSLGRRR